ncbi:hypothetical protein M501DRAFT_927313 [Patellaria atrata CBS 101060]|uniref:RING-type domain-containing protein n=1 Tax=Patellaria atrata CBS 101060 TaxID=1346257 RepID=A0A9P4VW00_9PEZI|nr:hypothetical protein M501DRAFT_927313 [Patellaria atrata CBS 101060]
MESPLKCNVLRCRSLVTERAVVTTCCHIFCLACSDDMGLSGSNNHNRTCPNCNSPLNQPDDAVVTHLNPSEDYKTSVLAGLPPSIVMEIAGRALSFYSYQVTHEVLYQEHIINSLSDKHATLNAQVDTMIYDANSAITRLQLEKKNLEQRNHELVEAYKEKSKTHSQTQKMYQNLKAQVLNSQAAAAATEDIEHHLQTATAQRFTDRIGLGVIGTSTYPQPSNIRELHSRARQSPISQERPYRNVPDITGSWNSQSQVPRTFSSREKPARPLPRSITNVY